MYRKKIVTALTLLLFLSMIAGIFFCALSMQKGEESRRGTLVRVRISRGRECEEGIQTCENTADKMWEVTL